MSSSANSKTVIDLSKLSPLDGTNYKRWSQRLLIFFETLETDYILTTPLPKSASGVDMPSLEGPDGSSSSTQLDIKPQNILVDENFNAKVSDFGLSKLFGKDQSHVFTAMRGTPGYMAPEWLSSSITEKVDVYSFGIVVLEILCGRRNFEGPEEEDRHVVRVFRRKQEEGQLMDLVDKFNEDMQSNAVEIVEMMKVADWCLQTEYAKRPSMSIVVKLIEGSVDVAGNTNEDFVNGLTDLEAMERPCSTVLHSMLSGPR